LTESAIRAREISKHFGATTALADVNFDVQPGEIHAVVGENGAGKSTLIRILSGVHRPDKGSLLVGGEARHFATPREAIAAGIATIHQELRLVPALSVAENLTLGDLPVRRILHLAHVLDRQRMREEARAALDVLDFRPDLDRPVRQLPVGERQLVAIAKALRLRCGVLILDEPTEALANREIDRLFALLGGMKGRGVAIIYISHRLDEIVTLADRCTVLRDGRVSAVARRGDFDVAALIEAMTGRVAGKSHRKRASPGETLLEDARGGDNAIRVRAREAIGFAGMLGSGRDRLLRSLFGIEGEPARVLIKGVPKRLSSPRQAVAAGIGMVPGERGLGLVMNQSVRDNILLASLDRFSPVRLNKSEADHAVSYLLDLLDIRPRRPDLVVSALSGGNQQKVMLAKWLAREVDLLLLADPTQGVDIAAKQQIHALVHDFIERGGGVLIASGDLGELARLCDWVLVWRGGRICARMQAAGGLPERELLRAMGG
jgi:ABC-type sugar transport system ATPase subunit